ncbi:hypothetical protein [Roseimarinus sediminis]|uniref:hypothetical protein n=1 Tax=Roseimarinus sediminis TaxID=1610899 RepID=UPI003D192328
MIKNPIDYSFGPAGRNAGILIFVAGLAVIYFSYLGIALTLVGATMAFTRTTTIIDTREKRIRFDEKLMGIFGFGKWIDLLPAMYLKIEAETRGFSINSQSNKTFNLKEKSYKIILLNQEGEKVMPVKKCRNKQDAENDLTVLATQMGLDEKKA